MSSSATPERPRWLAAALAEFAVVAALVGAFLWIYTMRYAQPAAAIAPHALLAGSLALAVAGVRLLLHRALPAAPARTLGAALATVFLLVLAVYYALVVVGLESWGRVISWRLIATYAPQAGELLDVLGFPAWLAALAGVALALAAHLAVARRFRRRDWTQGAARAGSALAVWSAGLAFAAMGVAQVLILATDPRVAAAEPVALTFFPQRAAAPAQSHLIANNARAEAEDRAARAAYRPGTPHSRPNVILVVADALRADHVQLMGYARPTTPFLVQLERAGRLRKAGNMRAVCGESSCGLMGIAKSAFVHQLTPHSFALPEVLKLHGYRTRMILGGDHTNFYDLRAAYGAIDHYFDGSMATRSYMNDDRFVLQRVQALPPWDGTPEFIQFHLMSSHAAGKRFLPATFEPQVNYYRLRPDPASAEAAPEAANYYDNGVLQFDHVLQALLAALDARGYLRDAIVVVTADHGEMLGEHGEIAHARSVREGVLRVPFAMIGFGRALAPLAEPDGLASQVDIAPTVATEIGLPLPASWRGQPLQQPRRRDHLPFQQGLRVGAYDADADGVRKYWRDLADGSEHAARIRGDAETSVPADAFGPAWLARMRLRTVAATGGAIQEDTLPP